MYGQPQHAATDHAGNDIGIVVVPFAGVLAAIILLWNRAVDWTDLGILAAMYLITAVGITVGFHRLLTHRAFQTYAWLERYQLRWDLLIMRDFGDYEASREFKRKAAGDLRRYGFDLRLAFEDDPNNFANNPERASAAGRKGGHQSHKND